MRVIKERTVYTICQIGKYRGASESLVAWLHEAQEANWTKSADLKRTYPTASIIDKKRVVFNIRGNEYRLVVDIDYRLRFVFIIWFGTHHEYQKLTIKKLTYGNKGY
jgi:mRNA interferase HigB